MWKDFSGYICFAGVGSFSNVLYSKLEIKTASLYLNI